MGLSTQVADKDRQAASHYPYPLTPILGVLSFVSASVVMGILAYFIHYLRMDNMSAPNELVFALGVACVTLLNQLIALIRHKFSVVPAGLNLLSHLITSCNIDLWQTNMGIMVCRLYKALYSFIVISLVFEGANAALDCWVFREQKSTGMYQPMESKSPGKL